MTAATATPQPAQILATPNTDGTVTLAIHNAAQTASVDLVPSETYAIARYLEWLTDAPGSTPEPLNDCPDGAAVWGDREADTVHIAIIDDDDEDGFGSAIILDHFAGTVLSIQLYAHCVTAALPE